MSTNTGTVKWFNLEKGFGFIIPDHGNSDIFFHVTTLQKSGIQALKEGERVTYDLVTERGKTAAGNIKRAA